MQDIRAFEVAGPAHAKSLDGDLERARQLIAQWLKRFAGFGDGPDEELAFDAFRVGISGAIEAAFSPAHLAQDIGVDVLGHSAMLPVAGQLPGMQIKPAQLGVVIEHLLEVRHKPMRVDAVAGETAADMIIDAARRHLKQSKIQPLPGPLVAAALDITQQYFQADGVGELGGSAKAAMYAVHASQQLPRRLIQQLDGQAAVVLAPDCQDIAPQHLMQVIGLSLELIAFALIGFVNRAHQLGERGPAVLAGLGIVGAAIEGPSIGQQEDGHGPAALPGDGLHSLHVDIVDIGAFFAVDLDVDEERVHHLGGRGVFKAFMRHDVAPVAGAVTDAEQDGFVLRARHTEGFLAPGVPVDRVIGMLQEVGAAFGFQAVHVAPRFRLPGISLA